MVLSNDHKKHKKVIGGDDSNYYLIFLLVCIHYLFLFGGHPVLRIKVLKVNPSNYIINWKRMEEAPQSKRKHLYPVKNRNGVYKQGRHCWAEVGGRVYDFGIDSFNMILEELNANERPVSREQLDAARCLLKREPRNEYLQGLCHQYDAARYLRRISLDHKSFLRVVKKKHPPK